MNQFTIGDQPVQCISTSFSPCLTTSYPADPVAKPHAQLHDYAWFEAQAEKDARRANRKAGLVLLAVVVLFVLAGLGFA